MGHYQDWQWATETLATARNKDAGKPVQNNTRLFQRTDNSIAVKLHAVDVVTINNDDTWTLRAGGWHTVTTMQRIRGYSPARLFSERGEWFLRLEPNPDDPEPSVYNRTVPKPYTAVDPGPEPVRNDDDPRHIIGRTERHMKLISDYSWRQGAADGVKYTDWYGKDEFADLFSAAGIKHGYGDDGSEKVLKLIDTGIYFGEEDERGWGRKDDGWIEFSEQGNRNSYDAHNTVDIGGIRWSYRQCPHCKAFDNIHEAWRLRYEGSWHEDRRFDKQQNFKTYAAMMDKYGSMQAWQEAYIEDFRARREYLKAEREWQIRNRVSFFDGITVDRDGYAPRLRSDGPSPAKLRRHEVAVAKMKKRIDKYVNGFIAELKTGKMPMPSSGDCWYCLMFDAVQPNEIGQRPTTVKPGSTTGNDHLISHMNERYYVPSLAVNALRERGYKDVGVYMWLDMNDDTQTMGRPDGRYDGVKRDLVKYLSKRLVPEAPTQ